MPETEPGVGPNPDAGNQGTGGRAEGGKNPSDPGAGEPGTTPSPDITALQNQLALEKQNSAASARQEQINRQQMQAQAGRIAQLEKDNQAKQTVQEGNQPPAPAGEFQSLEQAAAELKKGMFDNDDAAINRGVASIVAAGAREGRKQAVEDNKEVLSEQQRRQQVGQYFAPHQESLAKPDDPVTKRALELYGQMEPQYQAGQLMNWLPNDTIQIQIAPGVNHQVNIHLLKEAHQRAAVEVAQGTVPAPVAPIQPEYLEPSGRGGGGKPTAEIPNVEDLLSEDDRVAALAYFDGDTDEAKYQAYFDSFSPALKESRKKLGRPVSSTELISAGIMESGKK